MSFLCIKPACDSLQCVACNCAVPEKRAEFEAFAKRYTARPCWQDKSGEYVNAEVAAMWRAWCAALISARQE